MILAGRLKALAFVSGLFLLSQPALAQHRTVLIKANKAAQKVEGKAPTHKECEERKEDYLKHCMQHAHRPADEKECHETAIEVFQECKDHIEPKVTGDSGDSKGMVPTPGEGAESGKKPLKKPSKKNVD